MRMSAGLSLVACMEGSLKSLPRTQQGATWLHTLLGKYHLPPICIEAIVMESEFDNPQANSKHHIIVGHATTTDLLAQRIKQIPFFTTKN